MLTWFKPVNRSKALMTGMPSYGVYICRQLCSPSFIHRILRCTTTTAQTSLCQVKHLDIWIVFILNLNIFSCFVFFPQFMADGRYFARQHSSRTYNIHRPQRQIANFLAKLLHILLLAQIPAARLSLQVYSVLLSAFLGGEGKGGSNFSPTLPCVLKFLQNFLN